MIDQQHEAEALHGAIIKGHLMELIAQWRVAEKLMHTMMPEQEDPHQYDKMYGYSLAVKDMCNDLEEILTVHEEDEPIEGD